MRSLIRRLARGGLAALAVICVLTCGSGDKPTEPPQPPPPKDYPVYFSDGGQAPHLYTYHPVTKQIDSVTVTWQPRAMTVSPDGQRLYMAQRSSVVVVNIQSLSVIAELPYETNLKPVIASPDGEYVAIVGDDLYILRTGDYSVVFSDTIFAYYGCFSSDSKSFYSTSGGVYRLDLSDGNFSVTRRPFKEGSVVHVVPSPNEDKWFLYLGLRTWVSAFAAYDVLADSVIFMHVLVPGYGHLALTPDGSHVFYTNPGRTATDPWPDPCFFIYDVQTNRLEREICDLEFFSDSNWYMVPNRLAVTPDGCWLAMMGGSMALQVLYLYDIREARLVHREHFGGANKKTFTNLTVQTNK